jgi:hypothetical protein
MEDSILLSVKKNLGLPASYTPFDEQVSTHLNSALAIVDQLGVGPDGGFYISGEDEKWSDITLPPNQLSMLKTLIFLKVRLLFDPPKTSFAITAMEKQIEMFEWRINEMREHVLIQETNL